MSLHDVTVTPEWISIHADYVDRDRCGSIPGGRWDKESRRWRYPATAATAASIIATFYEDRIPPLPLAELARTIYSADYDRVAPMSEPMNAGARWAERMPTLWRHQGGAYGFALRRPAALLDMTMGSGKTRVAVEVANDDPEVRVVLVVTPLSVIAHWIAQVRRFSVREPVVVDLTQCPVKQASIDAAHEIARSDGKHQLWLLANRERFWRPPLDDLLLTAPPDMAIIDEVHLLKDPGGRASMYAAKLGRVVRRRLGLSGTPLAHSPLDGYALFRYLDPGVFGTNFVSFRKKYAVMGGFEQREVIGYQNTHEYRERYRWLTFEAAADVLDLPDFHHVEHEVRMPPRAKAVYVSLRDEFVAELDSGVVTAKNALVKLLRLQQITSGYAPADEGGHVSELHQEKRRALKEILERLPFEERVVVFCRFIHDLDATHHAAREAGTSSCELSGRRKELAAWEGSQYPDWSPTNRSVDNRHPPRVIAVQIQAGGLGVDTLKLARHCVFYSLGFSLSEYEQALARVRRPGQEHVVFYHHLIAVGTVDRQVYRALRERREVIDSILQRGLHEEEE